jgi:hypothetical protein
VLIFSLGLDLRLGVKVKPQHKGRVGLVYGVNPTYITFIDEAGNAL